MIEEAVSIHRGGVESYDFHALEVLESMIESRKGGETGVSKVEFLEGEAMWQAGKEGRWDYSLVEKAMETEPAYKPGQKVDLKHGILLEYKDGTKAAILSITGIQWAFACRVKGDPVIKATTFDRGPWNNRNLFKALSHAIQTFFREGDAPYPVERTLLTSGVLEAAMISRHNHKPIETPYLEFSYQPKDYKAMREMGKTWTIITEETPEPELIAPHGL
ncbi:MAG: hypothetical protein R3C11_11935 [Planctomycetaceae bacterium]